MLTAVAPKCRKIDRVERTGNALFLYSKHGTMRIEPKSDNIVRVTYTVQDTFSGEKKPGVVAEGIFGDWTFDNGPDLSIEVKLPGLRLSVKRNDGSVRYFDGNGKLLFAEDTGAPREFEEFEMFHLAGVPQKTGSSILPTVRRKFWRMHSGYRPGKASTSDIILILVMKRSTDSDSRRRDVPPFAERDSIYIRATGRLPFPSLSQLQVTVSLQTATVLLFSTIMKMVHISIPKVLPNRISILSRAA